MFAWIRRHWVLVTFALFLAAWATLLSFVSPDTIVDRVGVHNTYLIIFLLSVFGGLSTITGTSLFFTIATFASGGADPWLLGLAGGLGIFISDSLFFIVANHEVRVFTESENRAITWLAKKMEKLPPWSVYTGSFVYMGFTPLPNDLLMIALALTKHSYEQLAPVILVGSLTIATAVAHIGAASVL